MDIIVNQPVKLPFVSTGLVTGLTTFTSTITNNGNVVVLSPTFTEIGGGLYTATFTPATTGEWLLFIQGQIQARFTVVTKSLYTVIQDLTDEALGSWTWNKTTGLLTLYKSDATTLATYNIVDTLESSSRERLS